MLELEQKKWMFWRGSETKVKEAPKRLVSVTKVSLPKAHLCDKEKDIKKGLFYGILESC
jgi:hypothetical protein